jgi:hypothetical protein
MKKLLLISIMAIALKSQAQNVGIDVAMPIHKLHVSGGTTSADVSIGITNRITTDAILRGAQFRMVGSDLFISNHESTGKFSLATNFNERITILSNGKVGVGINNPVSSAILEVNGDTKINGEVNRPTTGSANMVPIAYGAILSNGTIQANSGNITCARVGVGSYEITITGENYFYLNYITSTTCMPSTSFPRIISAGSVSGNLTINIYDTDGTLADTAFSFVTYKP